MAKGAKRTTRKKAGNRQAKRKTKRAAKSPPVKAPPSARNLQTQIEVWDAYLRLRSRARVAAELGYSERIVRDVLASDPERLRMMNDSIREDRAARWEQHEGRALVVIDRLLAIAEAQVAEIMLAAAEGRVTSIRDKDGYQLPVLDAVNLMVMSRMLDQMVGVSTRAADAVNRYRGETADKAGAAGPAGQSFETMTDAELAEVIRAGGVPVPAILAQKVKMLEAQQDGAA